MRNRSLWATPLTDFATSDNTVYVNQGPSKGINSLLNKWMAKMLVFRSFKLICWRRCNYIRADPVSIYASGGRGNRTYSGHIDPKSLVAHTRDFKSMNQCVPSNPILQEHLMAFSLPQVTDESQVSKWYAEQMFDDLYAVLTYAHPPVKAVPKTQI